jgi:hypothetical protein
MSFIPNPITIARMILGPCPTSLPCPAEFRRWLLSKLSALLYCSHAFHVQIVRYLPSAVFGFCLCPFVLCL